MSEYLTIDGSHGEGGGQILRTSLTLAALTDHAVRLIHIRAGRKKPGLRPQHLAAVRAMAAICDAAVDGAARDSQTLIFAPRHAPRAGSYHFDVSEVAGYRSAGAVTLILQTVLLPLAMAQGPSRVVLRGGTNVPFSPPALYLEHVFLPTLARMGLHAHLTHRVWGFNPGGGGELFLELEGNDHLRGLDLSERGKLLSVWGMAYVAKLPSHIPQRMTQRALSLLRPLSVPLTVLPQHVESPSVGAGIFLAARYEHAVAGFSSLGRRGLRAEVVAEKACRLMMQFHHNGAAVDAHLGDQLVLPFLLAEGVSRASLAQVTSHLLTNVWVTGLFDLTPLEIVGSLGNPGKLLRWSNNGE